MKVVQIAAEVAPFAKTGGLADVVGSLPQALARLGHDVRVVMPKYASVTEDKFPLTTVLDALTVPLGAKSRTVAVRQFSGDHAAPTYFVDAPDLFARPQLYGHADDPLRFATFCRTALEMLKAINYQPEVVHCHDWHAGLAPCYLKTLYAADPFFASTATVFTVHNLGYQGVFPKDVFPLTDLDWSLFNYRQLEFYGQVNFMKGGLVFADALNTVSEQYAQEIQTPEYGERLEGVMTERRDRLFGIINGIDYEEWNPQTDRFIAANYDVRHLSSKARCKRALQQRCGLPDTGRKRVPLIGVVSRLSGQKGFDLVAKAIDALMSLDVQLVVLGAGDEYYTGLFRAIGEKYPHKASLRLGVFDNALAHQIYAGSDLFLMPSRYEPCGLGQLISLAYGTIPVVRATGGLADTITEFDPKTGTGNGFLFTDYTADALLAAVQRAVKTYRSLRLFPQLVKNALACDFSWEASAKKYIALYERALAWRQG